MPVLYKYLGVRFCVWSKRWRREMTQDCRFNLLCLRRRYKCKASANPVCYVYIYIYKLVEWCHSRRALRSPHIKWNHPACFCGATNPKRIKRSWMPETLPDIWKGVGSNVWYPPISHTHLLEDNPPISHTHSLEDKCIMQNVPQTNTHTQTKLQSCFCFFYIYIYTKHFF